MVLNSYFEKFLALIRPTPEQRGDCQTGHTTLRDRLAEDENLAPIIVSTFLQGSYRRATAIRAVEGERSDVDIIVVTNLNQSEYSPSAALQKFVPFLKRHYEGKYRPQGRSFGIDLSYVSLDLVVTSAPSEVDQEALKSYNVVSGYNAESLENVTVLLKASTRVPDWKLSPLYIPDREAKCWTPTHPLEQIKQTWAKSKACSGHYVNVVKAIKWWRRVKHPTPEDPRSYPLEHLIWTCCPDGIASVAEGVTRTLEAISDWYSLGIKPVLPDHGVPEHDVLRRVDGKDFAKFHAQVSDAAKIARKALDSQDVTESANGWRELFGEEKFPAPPEDEGSKYPERNGKTVLGGGRFS